MNLTGDIQLSPQKLFSSSSTQFHALGSRGVTRDGRVFRYVKAGASALVVGNCIQAPAQVTTHDQLTPSAAAIGATEITVTLDATNAATANQYAEGWACIDTTPGLGYMYPISSHPAAAASATLVLTLQRDAAIEVALTATSRVTLVSNPYRAVIQTPVTTLTNSCVGVAVYPTTLAEFGWVQTHGPCGVLIDGTPAVSNAVSCPAAAAGAAAINSGTLQIIGQMMVTGVDTKVLPVFLTID